MAFLSTGELIAGATKPWQIVSVREHLIGVISDTHGLVRPEALAALGGCERIVHAGDIGSADVLDALAALAPLTAVRGNNDRFPGAEKIPETDLVAIGGCKLYVLHDVHDLDLDPREAGFSAVIAGHSHRPAIEDRAGVLFVNPGSAGPRRFKLPVAVARLRVRNGRAHGKLVLLDV